MKPLVRALGLHTVWETRALDEDTFPAKPNPNVLPISPGSATSLLKLRAPIQLQILGQQSDRETLDKARLSDPNTVQPFVAPQAETEEVSPNRATFELLVNNRRYHQQDAIASFNAGKRIGFPIESIKIKANWKAISEADMAGYHRNKDASGKLFGLITLHIISDDIRTWVCATFKHVDNPNRCKVTGCQDTFRSTADGNIFSQLIARFNSANLGLEWQSLRLDGASDPKWFYGGSTPSRPVSSNSTSSGICSRSGRPPSGKEHP